MEYDVIIVGGGPAGMQTALHLKKLGIDSLLILEMEKSLGGALRDIIEEDPSFGDSGTTGVELAHDLIGRITEENIPYRTVTQVLSIEKDLTVSAVTMDEGIMDLRCRALILATGARERPRGALNFTSKRSTGIFSVGTARKFVVEEGYLPGRNIVIYGSDITGLYLAKILMIEGAKSVTVLDPSKEIRYPNLDMEEILKTLGVRFMTSHTMKEIEGNERITGIVAEKNGTEETDFIPCDTLLLSVGLSPQKSLIKKFRREPENSGVFVTGNADSVTFNMDEIVEGARVTAEKVAEFLKREEQQ